MKKMTLDVNTGGLRINENEIELESYDSFIKSHFFQLSDDLTCVGKYCFFAKEIIWHNEPFTIEFRPAFFSFKKSVYLISKSGGYFQSLHDWNKKADLNMLKDEEKRLYEWTRNKYPGNYDGEIKNPPYGYVWCFQWGNVAVQSNSNTFECGIYIEWN
ncbi:hypothetical protein [Pantoea stewartii]|uniref:hypothetical protein n=1 Tax=Pantoea stewartii TaxID=66269 RepID=UPI00345BC6C5